MQQITPEVLEFEEDAEDGGASDEDEDEDAEKSDTEANAADTKLKARANGTESDDSSDDDEDSEGEDDLDLEVDEELRAKILEALKASGVNEEDEDEGDGGVEEEEEELLDDDQMMELDDKLAEIFKQRKSASKSAKEAAQATHDAQLKVIDFLEIFAKQQSASPLVLNTILPLFNAARRSGKEDSDIASKALRALTGIVSKAKDYPSVTNIASVLEVLQGVHQGSARSGTEEIESVAIAASLYLCKIALADPKAENVSAIVDIYKSSLNSYLIKKSCRLHGRFFESFINRYRDAAWQLRGDLLKACSEATKTADKHRRAACFHLLSTLLATHAALVSVIVDLASSEVPCELIYVSQKTPEAKQEVIDFVPEYVQVFIDTFNAATEGTGMQLQIARLREILKACAEAVKATKNALKDGPDVAPWDLWRAKELPEVFAHMSQSKNIEKTGSLNSTIRSLMDSINQGSGRAKVRVVKKGEPTMLPTDENGKPLTRLDQRQIKKALVRPEKEARRAAQELKKENKKRKRQETDLNEHGSTSKQNGSEDHGASTSEDSD